MSARRLNTRTDGVTSEGRGRDERRHVEAVSPLPFNDAQTSSRVVVSTRIALPVDVLDESVRKAGTEN
jgi:hypothetical protein